MLTAFAAFLSQSVSAATIRSYLLGIRCFQIRAGLANPSLNSPPKLCYFLKGIRALNPSDYPLHPTCCGGLWSMSFDTVMLWAAFCLGVFRFFRSGEFTQSPHTEYVLTREDVAIDSREDPQLLTVRLRKSKTDPFGAGTYIYIGRTGTTLCPVPSVLAYLAIRPQRQGPLFIFENGARLSKQVLVSHLRQALLQLGEDDMKFTGHSFRIGAATTAAAAGFSEYFIQFLGRWKSSAYLAYITTP